ncbi:sigma-54-dependent Fis family transcriptional regulator, partial [Vibrio cholerae]|nr:sigma-54-dependent Fis family transcriptional regulator [Vibrio cholerae]
MCDVFLIDDESDIRIALAQSFELADLNAQFFASVEEALLAIKAQGLPLVIVSDICLPGLSGQNLLSSVLHQDSELPVILITGHGDISMAVKAMHDGAYDFIEKPFAPERLIDTVHRAIE